MRFPPIRYVIQEDCNDTVAKTYGQPEQKADALLLAAAPELLAMLIKLEAHADTLQSMLPDTQAGKVFADMKQARAAIAKARGAA